MRAPVASLLVLVTATCCGSPTSPLPPRPPQAADVTPRARAHVEALVANLLADTPGKHPQLTAMFAPGSVVLWPRGTTIEAAIDNLREGVLAADSADAPTGATISSLFAGGTEDALWVQAELAIHRETGTGVSTSAVARVSALVRFDGAGRGTNLATAFGQRRMPETGSTSAPVDGATSDGPLTQLALSPAAIARSIRDDQRIAVFGLASEQASDAASARSLLAQIAGTGRFTLQSPPREIRTSSYGFVQAHLDLAIPGEERPRRVAVQLIAYPTGTGGWTVGSVHYLPLR